MFRWRTISSSSSSFSLFTFLNKYTIRPSLSGSKPLYNNTRMASTLPRLPVFQAIAAHDPTSTVAIHSQSGRSFTYGELLSDVADAKDALLAHNKDIKGERIAFLVENSYDYVGAQLVSLSSSYTPTLLNCLGYEDIQSYKL